MFTSILYEPDMRSKSFEQFEAQLRSTGRLHGEGFVEGFFHGMTDDELSEATELLESAALVGDSTAVEGLRQLESAQATDALRKVASRGVLDIVSVSAASALYARSRDQSLPAFIVRGVVSPDHSLRWISIQMLPVRDITGRDVRDCILRALRGIVTNSDDLVERNMAAKKLLQLVDVSTISNEYKDIVRGLSDDSYQTRQDTLSRLNL